MDKETILAICYDFDKTLSPDDMQAQGYIQSLGYEVSDFWAESNRLSEENDMDQNLAYMYMMATKSRGKLIVNRERLRLDGSKVALFPGVESWFCRVNAYGAKKGVTVEHYIISSGLKEMIEGTKVAGEFKKIYASSFYFDDDGVAVWPAQVVNYTNKTQFLFRIEKGVLNVNDQDVNSYFTAEEYRVPFRNMVYIGDSDTDIPCMKLVTVNGGHAIGVYNAKTQDRSKVFRMLEENRIRYFAPADYEENSPLEILIKQIIDRTVTNDALERVHFSCMNEMRKETEGISREARHRDDLVNRLEDSTSFSTTHHVIAEMKSVTDWSETQRNRLFEIALRNDQVRSILHDHDVQRFYEKLLANGGPLAEEVRKLLGHMLSR